MIVDTDVLIDFLYGDEKVCEVIAKKMTSENLATTIINHYELFKGAITEKQEDAVTLLLSKFELYHLDQASVRNAAKIFQSTKRSGKPIPEADILIASIAQSNSTYILTRDNHFKDLRMIDVEII